jgi:thioester reductase-like protein
MSTKCANCSDKATHIYEPEKGHKLFFCYNHLPSFLHDQRKAGLLETTDAHDTHVEESKAVLEELATKTPEERNPIDLEPVLIDTSVDEKTTKKKAVKKNTDDVQPSE